MGKIQPIEVEVVHMPLLVEERGDSEDHNIEEMVVEMGIRGWELTAVYLVREFGNILIE